MLPRSRLTWLSVRMLSAEPPPMKVRVPPAIVTALAAAMRVGFAVALRP